jgi:TolA-binding protein
MGDGSTPPRLGSAAAATVYTPARRPGQSAPGPAGRAPAPASGANVPPPRELYSQAYTDYARATTTWRSGLPGVPAELSDTEFADNAQYWIGECLYSSRSSPRPSPRGRALPEVPAGDKLPDARLKKGLALERMGRRRDALREYRFVVDRYPNTEAARKARDKIGTP